jgi:hypothetical protein
MLVTKTSVLTGQPVTMELPVTQAQLDQYQSGGLVQDVFPDLNPEQREFLISGITPDVWDATF